MKSKTTKRASIEAVKKETVKERNNIPDATYWANLRKAYFKVKATSNDEHDNDLRAALAEAPKGGALVKFEVRQGEYGRGVYATQHIPKGTPVWNCKHCGVFRTKQQWRDFLRLLPNHVQHDCVEWAYVEDGDLWLDLDPSALMNHGGSHIEEESDIKSVKPDNLVCVEIDAEEDEWQYIAKCDIDPNSELLTDYSKFHNYSESLSWFEESWERIVEEGNYYRNAARFGWLRRVMMRW